MEAKMAHESNTMKHQAILGEVETDKLCLDGWDVSPAGHCVGNISLKSYASFFFFGYFFCFELLF
ncbi:unnamed protein product [Onchocerca flexuosa]|uniref:Uncharacterized protein n=1 Tax=Onchocerca flexuosa TaxID=387005 RepID=A0A183HVT8_9BILA|nr:unnamed protein product [Onchocerca flexuosa]